MTETITASRAYSHLQEWLEQITDTWSCPECHSRAKTSIDLFALNDGEVLELIICAKCGHEDHNAVMHITVKFEGTSQ